MNKYLIGLCLGFVTLTGCSRLDIAFRWVDTYIASKVDDYFDTTSKQSKDLKSGIQKDLREIKAQVLPVWIERLQGIQKEVQEGTINEERVAHYFGEFMKDVEQLNSYFANTAVDFIGSTNSKQFAYFSQSFTKKYQEDLEKARDPEKIKSEYRKKYLQWFEMFLGSLTPEQEKLLEDNLNNSPFPAEAKANNKNYVAQVFLNHRDSPEQMKVFVKDYFLNQTRYDSPEYRSVFTKYLSDLQALVAQVVSTMTEKQKKNLKENIDEKIVQLQRIISRG